MLGLEMNLNTAYWMASNFQCWFATYRSANKIFQITLFKFTASYTFIGTSLLTLNKNILFMIIWCNKEQCKNLLVQLTEATGNHSVIKSLHCICKLVYFWLQFLDSRRLTKRKTTLLRPFFVPKCPLIDGCLLSGWLDIFLVAVCNIYGCYWLTKFRKKLICFLQWFFRLASLRVVNVYDIDTKTYLIKLAK